MIALTYEGEERQVNAGKRAYLRSAIGVCALFGAALAAASAHAENQEAGEDKLYFIGQDLASIRGYLASDCCPVADGGTAYLGFYSLLDPDANFGGLGVNQDLEPIASEVGWGAGPVSAWKTAVETGGTHLAIGLDMTGEPEAGDLAQIADGKFDPQIDHLARFIAATGKTVLLRVGYEFDGAWNTAYGDHEAYVSAWKHIVERIRASGTNNVEFVWQGSASPIDDVIDQGHDDIGLWYPGDDYVDWVGTSWFVNPDEVPVSARSSGYVPASARTLTDELLDFARTRGKPVFVAELAPQGFDLQDGTRRHITAIWDGPSGEGTVSLCPDQIWDGWYAKFLSYLNANNDVIHAVAYINADWDAQTMWGSPYASGYWGNSRLEDSPQIAARWSEQIGRWRGDKEE